MFLYDDPETVCFSLQVSDALMLLLRLFPLIHRTHANDCKATLLITAATPHDMHTGRGGAALTSDLSDLNQPARPLPSISHQKLAGDRSRSDSPIVVDSNILGVASAE